MIYLPNGVQVPHAITVTPVTHMTVKVKYTTSIDKLLTANPVTPYLTSGYRGIRIIVTGDTIIDVVNPIIESKRRILKT